MTPSVVLVTGVSRFLGARLAAELSRQPGVARVIGVDADPPLAAGPIGPDRAGGGTVEFVRADICHPRVARLVIEARVDTVVHVGAGVAPLMPDGHPWSRGADAVGTLQLLATCQQSAHLRRLVVRSTTAVYGQSCRDPALFVESDTDKSDTDPPQRGGYARDAVEVETYVRAFCRRRPDVSVTVLRLANLIGPRMPTPLARYFGGPAIPTVWGRDPRLQFVHEHDAVAVFRLAALGAGATPAPHPPVGSTSSAGPTGSGGRRVVNVAGSGVLTLSQAIRRAGRVAVPVPGAAGTLLTGLVHRAGIADLHPDRTGLLTFDGIVDTTRLRRDFGYRPCFSTAQAFDEFVRGQLAPDGAGRCADE